MEQPIAIWNSELQVWTSMDQNQLLEQWALWQEVWPTSGMTVGGQLLPLPMQVRHTEDSECSFLPTPQTMDTLPARTGEARERQLYRGGDSRRSSSGNLREDILDTLPTPTTRDYKDGQSPHERDGEVQTDTVARAIFNSGEVQVLPTPLVDDAKNTGHNQTRIKTLASEVWETERTTNWGKFEPAIRRWEQLTRLAPAPTLPDGKDGAHRLSSKFTEWMMGLPDGWITGHGLKRNDELKMAGNGVVPQQAELALRMLLGADLGTERERERLFPTPTVSDTFTDSLKSSQQKPGSMHSVTLPQAVMWTVGVELEKATSESL